MLTLEKKIIAFLLAVSPILDPYVVFNKIGIVNAIASILFIWIIVRNKSIKLNPLLLRLLIVLLVCTCVSLLNIEGHRDTGASLKVIINWSILFLLASSMWSFLDKEKFIKYSQGIAVFAATFLYIQVILYITTGNVLDGKIEFLGLSQYDNWASMIDISGSLRAHSVFQEPSYVAIYLLPVVASFIINKQYVKSAYLIVAMVLTTSTVAICGIILILIWFLIISNKKISTKIKVLILIIATHSILYMNFTQYSNIVDFAFNKLMMIGSDLKSDRLGSSKIRIIGYLPYYFDYPVYYKVFGVGANQFPEYLAQYNVLSYSSTIVTVILDFGILGIISLISMFRMFIKGSNRNTIIYTLIFIMICSIDSFWFNWYFFYILTFIIMNYNPKSKHIKCINIK